MPKVRLTPRTLDALRQQGRWLTDYWDEGLPRFGVRVSPSGRKTFVVRYEMDGRRRRLTLGSHPVLGLADARLRAIAALAAIEHGLDPTAKPAQEHEPTFDELAAEYLERHAKRKKRRWREDQRILRVDLLPAWRERTAGYRQVKPRLSE